MGDASPTGPHIDVFACYTSGRTVKISTHNAPKLAILRSKMEKKSGEGAPTSSRPSSTPTISGCAPLLPLRRDEFQDKRLRYRMMSGSCKRATVTSATVTAATVATESQTYSNCQKSNSFISQTQSLRPRFQKLTRPTYDPCHHAT